jgi:predicted neuraminidase
MTLGVRIILILLTWIALLFLIRREDAPAISSFQTLSSSPAAARNEKPFCKEVFVNDSQDLAFVHVASVIERPDHRLVALWYGGSYEHARDNTVYLSELHDGSWQQPRAIMTADEIEHSLLRPIKCLGNPLLLSESDGSLRLLFVTIAMGKWSGSQLNTCLSRDNGHTWSTVHRLTLSPLCNFAELVRNRPVKTESGWCFPAYQEFLGKFPELLWLSGQDDLVHYEKSRIAGGCATLQPSLLPLDKNRALVLLRDFSKTKRIFLARTEDGGAQWSRPLPTTLPNPDSGISGLLLQDGRLLVSYNDETFGRSNLSLALSNDAGHSWKKIADLENDNDKSFSYPYLMQSSDGVIQLAYSWDGEKIKLLSFNQAWVTEKEAAASKP